MLKWLLEWKREISCKEGTACQKARMFISNKTEFDLCSMVRGFRAYSKIMMDLFEGVHLVSSRTSQDYVELFFACQRAQQGQNNNPTEWQYGENSISYSMDNASEVIFWSISSLPGCENQAKMYVQNETILYRPVYPRAPFWSNVKTHWFSYP